MKNIKDDAKELIDWQWMIWTIEYLSKQLTGQAGNREEYILSHKGIT